MYPSVIISGLGIACIIAVACTGCLGSGPGGTGPGPAGTPVQVGHLVVDEQQDNATVQATTGGMLTVKLAENPTTGYRWELNTTGGLIVVNDTYIPSDKTGQLAGAGGTRVWDISVDKPGNQQVNAIYRRSWEPVTGNETTYTLSLIVT